MPASTEDKDDTPGVTEVRGLTWAFLNHTPFTEPKLNPDFVARSMCATITDEGGEKVKTGEATELSTIPIKQEEISTLSITKVGAIRKSIRRYDEEIQLLKAAQHTKEAPVGRADFTYHENDKRAGVSELPLYPKGNSRAGGKLSSESAPNGSSQPMKSSL